MMSTNVMFIIESLSHRQLCPVKGTTAQTERTSPKTTQSSVFLSRVYVQEEVNCDVKSLSLSHNDQMHIFLPLFV